MNYTKYTAPLLMLLLAMPVSAQYDPSGSVSVRFINGGRLIINLDAMDLPEYVMLPNGQSANTSYCLIVRPAVGSGDAYTETLLVDGSSVSHVGTGGKDGMYNLGLIDGDFKAINNFSLGKDVYSSHLFIYLGFTVFDSAKEINELAGNALCQYTPPVLFASLIVERGEMREIEMTFDEFF